MICFSSKTLLVQLVFVVFFITTDAQKPKSPFSITAGIDVSRQPDLKTSTTTENIALTCLCVGSKCNDGRQQCSPRDLCMITTTPNETLAGCADTLYCSWTSVSVKCCNTSLCNQITSPAPTVATVVKTLPTQMTTTSSALKMETSTFLLYICYIFLKNFVSSL